MSDYDSNKILYKYRGFSNLEFALDIFLNERLFSADFRKLNDPMEGRFRYSKQVVDKDRIREVLIEKSDLGILSLSENADNHLLWSYYAEGHSGFVVGVQIAPDQDITLKKVNYVDDLKVEHISAEEILTMKHDTWQHENEFRVLKSKYVDDFPFVKVRVKELIFGKNARRDNEGKMTMLTDLIKRINPNIAIRTIDSSTISEWVRNN